MSPQIATHIAFAVSALVIGPVVMWTRLGALIRPRWHRVLGRVWVACMLGAAASAAFIRSSLQPNLAGFSLIHLLVPYTVGMLWLAFWYLRRGDIRGHRRTMVGTYIGACLVAGAFALAPSRLLGHMLWGSVLG